MRNKTNTRAPEYNRCTINYNFYDSTKISLKKIIANKSNNMIKTADNFVQKKMSYVARGMKCNYSNRHQQTTVQIQYTENLCCSKYVSKISPVLNS